MIAGVDAYRRIWIVACGDGDDSTTLLEISSIGELLGHDELERIVVDVPLGLPERGVREADRQARERLGPRGGSVTPAPLWPMLPARTWKEASDIRYAIEGVKSTQQTYRIMNLVRQWNEVMSPALQERVREGHPELSLAEIAGAPLQQPKKKQEGQDRRLELLRAWFPDIDEAVRAFNRPNAMIDILDAYSLLWTARRIRDGEAYTLPEDPPTDRRGLRMEIVV